MENNTNQIKDATLTFISIIDPVQFALIETILQYK